MLENQVVYPAVHHQEEKWVTLLPGEPGEGNEHGARVWVISEKQTETRAEKSRGAEKRIPIPGENP